MQHRETKYKSLQLVNEADFRRNALVPLLKKMGFRSVMESYEAHEFGRDITFIEQSKIGNVYYAVIVRIGNLSSTTSGAENLRTIQEQIVETFNIPFYNPEDGEQHAIDRVIVWISGIFSRKAASLLEKTLKVKSSQVIFYDGQKTIDLLDQYYPGFYSINDPVVSEYYHNIKDHYNKLEELRALGSSETGKALPLMFVPPFLSPYHSSSKSLDKKKLEKGIIKQEKKLYSLDEINNMHENILILGAGGSGKTTLLRKLLIGIIEKNETSLQKEPIPFLINAKNIDFANESPIVLLIQKEFARFCSEAFKDECKIDFEHQKIVLFLDGIDELKSKVKIDNAIRLIQKFYEDYPQVRIILSSRFSGGIEETNILPMFRKLTIQDFNTEQMVKFIENWYGTETIPGKKLVKLISEPNSLHGLPATPLTLTILAILQESKPWQELPANQTELFSKYIELALGRWDASKELSVQFEFTIKRYILQRISWDIHSRNGHNIIDVDFDLWVQKLAQEHGFVIDIEIFRKEIIERSELLFINEEGIYEFKHRSFQDYFVGMEINRHSNATDIVVQHFLDPWWAEAIFFAGGLKPDHEDYLNEILQKVMVAPSDILYFVENLGQLIQATFLASISVKFKAAKKVLEKLMETWNYFCDIYEAMEDRDQIFKKISPQLFFLTLQASIVKRALGSITLAQTLSELTDYYMQQLDKPHDEIYSISLEWQAFLLAIACSETEKNVDDFLRIFESGYIKDLGFIMFGGSIANLLSKSTWISLDKRERLTAIYKRLGTKIKGNEKFITFITKENMIRLQLPASALEAEDDGNFPD